MEKILEEVNRNNENYTNDDHIFTMEDLQMDMSSHTKYPSRFGIGSEVCLKFDKECFLEGDNLYLNNCIISAIHFTSSKVWYDVEVQFIDGMYTIFKMVDSIFVHERE